MSPYDKPQIRLLNVTPMLEAGQERLVLSDRLGIAPELSLPRDLAPVLALVNGAHTVSDIVRRLQEDHDIDVPEEFITRLVSQLDQHYLLNSVRFRQRLHEEAENFARLPIRPASHAGLSYPLEATELRSALAHYERQAPELLLMGEPATPPEQVRGIIVPHIDFGRGGPVEALAYGHLARARFDVLVVLGIAHHGVEYPWCGTAKDFATPLGTARLHRPFFEALAKRLGPSFTAEEFVHRDEFSVEFVAVFLQYCAALRDVPLVPILCGSLPALPGEVPASDPLVADFCTALREVTGEFERAGQRVGFICSVDLAHQGSRFGHNEPLTDFCRKAIEQADLKLLQLIAAGDAAGFHHDLYADDNARNVDAHAAVYTVLQAFPELRANLLTYEQAYHPRENFLVSFASMEWVLPAACEVFCHE